MLCFLLFSVSKGLVYFTARTVEVIGTFWKKGEIIIFPLAISNVGGSYNASNGVFTAPHSGVYVFNVFLAWTHKNEIIGNIVVNGSPKVGAHLRPGIGSSHAFLGNSAVFPLIQGDRVWVEHKSGTILSTQPNAPISTFYGCSLQWNCLRKLDCMGPSITNQNVAKTKVINDKKWIFTLVNLFW